MEKRVVGREEHEVRVGKRGEEGQWAVEGTAGDQGFSWRRPQAEVVWADGAQDGETRGRGWPGRQACLST